LGRGPATSEPKSGVRAGKSPATANATVGSEDMLPGLADVVTHRHGTDKV
jgi:hypothetical protein